MSFDTGGCGRLLILSKHGKVAGAVATGALGALVPRRQQARVKAPEQPPTRAPESSRPPEVVEDRSKVTEFLGRIQPGTRFGRWRIDAIHAVWMGAVPIVLQTDDGERFQVDVLRRSTLGTPGVGNTRALSTFLVNQGDGALRTHEEHGLGAMALAQLLATREAEGANVPSLLTLEERLCRFPSGSFRVPI
jgi:hypothetical protein